MKRLSSKLTYSNVVATLALFLVLAGGTAFAAKQMLPKNSVGTKQLKNNAVTTAKIKNGAVTGSKVKVSTLAKVPSAATADTAKTAETAKSATTASSADSANLAKSLPALTWTPITIGGGWETFEPGEFGALPSYTKDLQGFVHLEGELGGEHSTSNVFGTLPQGFRPPQGAWVPISSTTGAYDPQLVNLWIKEDGELEVLNGTGANDEFVSLAGVEFYAGN